MAARNITNSMMYPQVLGLTGIIKFDIEGFRSSFELDILEVDSKAGLKKVFNISSFFLFLWFI